VSNGAAMWGGLIATAAARRPKGVIYEEEEKESFNLFKNIEDFRKFMEVNHPSIVLDLEKGKGDSKIDEATLEANNLEKIKG
jgi:hypothetical protein